MIETSDDHEGERVQVDWKSIQDRIQMRGELYDEVGVQERNYGCQAAGHASPAKHAGRDGHVSAFRQLELFSAMSDVQVSYSFC